MSTPLALQDILVSIADSLSQAQQQLNNMPLYDNFGRPNTIYQLPYLDFNIVLSTKFNLDEKMNGQEQDDPKIESNLPFQLEKAALNVSKINTSRLLFELPATSKATAAKSIEPATTVPKTKSIEKVEGEGAPPVGEPPVSDESHESLTTISGRFVAVFPNDGLPQTILNVSYEECSKKDNTNNVFIIKVHLMNTAGERLAHQRVEFNFDEDTSYLLNRDAIISLYNAKKITKDFKLTAPQFTSQEEYTNEEGYAETTVSVKKTDYTIVIRVNSGIIAKSISI
jgi:hypothetical protein